MTNPTILPGLIIKPVSQNQFGVFTTVSYPAYTVIETCAWIPVTQRLQILISKNSNQVNQVLFPNPDGIEKEKSILNKLAELELEQRLDAGLLTPSQVHSIINEVGGTDKLLHVVSHAILLGYGSIYRKSQTPNINWSYDTETKLYSFSTVQLVRPGQELTYFIN